MGICQSDDFDVNDWAFGKGHYRAKQCRTKQCRAKKAIHVSVTRPLIKSKQPTPKPPQLKYIRPHSKTIEEADVNFRIDYILHGLENDLFPANYTSTGNRRSWGVGTDIPSDIKVDSEVFAFDDLFKKHMNLVINYSKTLKSNYGDSGPPQLILNYKYGKYILRIECYTRDSELILNAKYTMDKSIARMYLRTMIEEGLNVYDLYNEIATYENK